VIKDQFMIMEHHAGGFHLPTTQARRVPSASKRAEVARRCMAATQNTVIMVRGLITEDRAGGHPPAAP